MDGSDVKLTKIIDLFSFLKSNFQFENNLFMLMKKTMSKIILNLLFIFSRLYLKIQNESFH